jgi:hypothetical protein
LDDDDEPESIDKTQHGLAMVVGAFSLSLFFIVKIIAWHSLCFFSRPQSICKRHHRMHQRLRPTSHGDTANNNDNDSKQQRQENGGTATDSRSRATEMTFLLSIVDNVILCLLLEPQHPPPTADADHDKQ